MVTPPDLLIGHQGEQAAGVCGIADMQILLTAEADVRRKAAFHAQPGDDDGA